MITERNSIYNKLRYSKLTRKSFAESKDARANSPSISEILVRDEEEFPTAGGSRTQFLWNLLVIVLFDALFVPFLFASPGNSHEKMYYFGLAVQ